ncbi:MAG TPA: cupin domain-containing protein, partial [Chloroflexota bacterium]|nr:cupin domain-containing protein [Chloroflexota bacterium]
MAVAMKSEVQPAVFPLKAQLLARGRSMDLLAKTDLMTAHIKVYAEGGENGLHTHPHEDHIFVVLAGQATFHTGIEETQRVVNKHEGILVPKGAFYRFETS